MASGLHVSTVWGGMNSHSFLTGLVWPIRLGSWREAVKTKMQGQIQGFFASLRMTTFYFGRGFRWVWKVI
jgi:hypothetical protein